MAVSESAVADILKALPQVEDIRQRIAENIRERRLLRQSLRLVQAREQSRAAGSQGEVAEGAA